MWAELCILLNKAYIPELDGFRMVQAAYSGFLKWLHNQCYLQFFWTFSFLWVKNNTKYMYTTKVSLSKELKVLQQPQWVWGQMTNFQVHVRVWKPTCQVWDYFQKLGLVHHTIPEPPKIIPTLRPLKVQIIFEVWMISGTKWALISLSVGPVSYFNK